MNHTMDITFVIARKGMPHLYGGEKSTIATATRLRAHGYTVSFLVPARDALNDVLAAEAIEYYPVETADPFAGMRSASWAGRAAKIGNLLRANFVVWRGARRRKTAVVHTSAIPGFFCSWLGAKLAGAKVVYHIRTASRDQRTRWFEELAVLLADRSIAVSEALREQIATTGHRLLRELLKKRIATIHNGFDFSAIDRFRQKSPRDDVRARLGVADRLVLLLVGGVFVDKGQLRFLQDVFVKLAKERPDVLLVLVGGIKDGRYSEGCHRAVDDAGLGDQVRFTGYLAQEDVYAWYQACDVLVLPSEREGLPRCAVEAQAFARPVVATRVVGTDEAVVDGRTGFLVANDRVADMLPHLLCLAGDAGLRETLGREGAAHVRRSFTLDKNVDAIHSLYQELCQRHVER